MASVPREAFLKEYVRGWPLYDLPLVLLARLAVDRRFAGRGLGQALISEALRLSACGWPTRWAAAVSSPTHTGTEPVGTENMALCRSREPQRAGHSGCFWTSARSGRRYGAERCQPDGGATPLVSPMIGFERGTMLSTEHSTHFPDKDHTLIDE